jgi:uncharacterized protein YqeY
MDAKTATGTLKALYEALEAARRVAGGKDKDGNAVTPEAKAAGAFEAGTLRPLIGDIANDQTRPNPKPVEEITIGKLNAFTKNADLFIKNLRDSGQTDSPLIAEKEAEKVIYARFLPSYMTTDELRAAIVAKFGDKLSTADKGPVNKFLKTEYAGKYQGRDSSAVIDSLIA